MQSIKGDRRVGISPMNWVNVLHTCKIPTAYRRNRNPTASEHVETGCSLRTTPITLASKAKTRSISKMKSL